MATNNTVPNTTTRIVAVPILYKCMKCNRVGHHWIMDCQNDSQQVSGISACNDNILDIISSYDFVWKIPFIKIDKIKIFMHGYLKQNMNSTLYKLMLNIINIFCSYINELFLMNNIKNSNCGQKFYSDILCINSLKFVIVIYPNGLSNDNDINTGQSFVSLQVISKDFIPCSSKIYLVECNETIEIKSEEKKHKYGQKTQMSLRPSKIKSDIKCLECITLGININIKNNGATQIKNEYYTNPKHETNHCDFYIDKKSIFNHSTSNIFDMHSLTWKLDIKYDENDLPKHFQLNCFVQNSRSRYGEINIYSICFYYRLFLKETQTEINGYDQFQFTRSGYARDTVLGKQCFCALDKMTFSSSEKNNLLQCDEFIFKLELTIIDYNTGASGKQKHIIDKTFLNHKPTVHYMSKKEFVWDIGYLTKNEIYLVCHGYCKQYDIPQDITQLIQLFYQNYDNDMDMKDLIQSIEHGSTLKSPIFSINGCKFIILFNPHLGETHKYIANSCEMAVLCKSKLKKFRQYQADKYQHFAAFSIHLVSAPAFSSNILIEQHSIICAEDDNIAHLRKCHKFDDKNSMNNMYLPLSIFDGVRKISLKLKLVILKMMDSYNNQILYDCKELHKLSSCPNGEYVWSVSLIDLRNDFISSNIFMMHGFRWVMRYNPRQFLTLELLTNSQHISSANFICTLYIDDDHTCSYTQILYCTREDLEKVSMGNKYGKDKYSNKIQFTAKQIQLKAESISFKIMIQVTEVRDENHRNIETNNKSQNLGINVCANTFNYRWQAAVVDKNKIDLIKGYCRKLTAKSISSDIIKLCFQYFIDYKDARQRPTSREYYTSNIFIMGPLRIRMQMEIDYYTDSYLHLEFVASKKIISKLSMFYRIKIPELLSMEIGHRDKHQPSRAKKSKEQQIQLAMSIRDEKQFNKYSQDAMLKYVADTNIVDQVHGCQDLIISRRYKIANKTQIQRLDQMTVQLEMNIVDSVFKYGDLVDIKSIPAPNTTNSYIQNVNWIISNYNLITMLKNSVEYAPIHSPMFSVHCAKFYFRLQNCLFSIHFASFPLNDFEMIFSVKGIIYLDKQQIRFDGIIQHSDSFNYKKTVHLNPKKYENLTSITFKIQFEVFEIFDEAGNSIDMHKTDKRSQKMSTKTIYNQDPFANYSPMYEFKLSKEVNSKHTLKSKIFSIDGFQWFWSFNLLQQILYLSLIIMPLSVRNVFVKWRILLRETDSIYSGITCFKSNQLKFECGKMRLHGQNRGEIMYSKLLSFVFQLHVIDIYDKIGNTFLIKSENNILYKPTKAKKCQWVITKDDYSTASSKICVGFFEMNGFEWCVELSSGSHAKSLKQYPPSFFSIGLKTLPKMISTVTIYFTALFNKDMTIVEHATFTHQKLFFVFQTKLTKRQLKSIELNAEFLGTNMQDKILMNIDQNQHHECTEYKSYPLPKYTSNQTNTYQFALLTKNIKRNVYHNAFKMHSLKFCLCILFDKDNKLPAEAVLKCIGDGHEKKVKFHYKFTINGNCFQIIGNGEFARNKSIKHSQFTANWHLGKINLSNTQANMLLNSDKLVFGIMIGINEVYHQNNAIISNRYINHQPTSIELPADDIIWKIKSISEKVLLLSASYLTNITGLSVPENIIELVALFYNGFRECTSNKMFSLKSFQSHMFFMKLTKTGISLYLVQTLSPIKIQFFYSMEIIAKHYNKKYRIENIEEICSDSFVTLNCFSFNFNWKSILQSSKLITVKLRLCILDTYPIGGFGSILNGILLPEQNNTGVVIDSSNVPLFTFDYKWQLRQKSVNLDPNVFVTGTLKWRTQISWSDYEGLNFSINSMASSLMISNINAECIFTIPQKNKTISMHCIFPCIDRKPRYEPWSKCFTLIRRADIRDVKQLTVNFKMNIINIVYKDKMSIPPTIFNPITTDVIWEISNQTIMKKIKTLFDRTHTDEISSIFSPIFEIHSLKFYFAIEEGTLNVYHISNISECHELLFIFKATSNCCDLSFNSSMITLIRTSEWSYCKTEMSSHLYSKRHQMLYIDNSTPIQFKFEIKLLDAFDKNGKNIMPHICEYNNKSNETIIYNETNFDDIRDSTPKYIWTHETSNESEVIETGKFKWMIAIKNRNMNLCLMSYPLEMHSVTIKYKLLYTEKDEEEKDEAFEHIGVQTYKQTHSSNSILDYMSKSVLSYSIQIMIIHILDKEGNEIKIHPIDRLTVDQLSQPTIFEWQFQNMKLNDIQTLRNVQSVCSDMFVTNGVNFYLKFFPHGTNTKYIGDGVIQIGVQSLSPEIDAVMIRYKLILKETEFTVKDSSKTFTHTNTLTRSLSLKSQKGTRLCFLDVLSFELQIQVVDIHTKIVK
eukprot:503204_1